MATSTFNAQEIELRRQLLREELASLEDAKLKNLGSMQVVDYHHPERSPGWPLYRHQEFPKMLYHPSEKDSRIEETRLGVRRRNEANPHLAPMDIPRSEPLMRKVANKAEMEQALAEGFVLDPPVRQLIDGNSPLDVIGRAAGNPLTNEQLLPAPPQPLLSVAEILQLNALSKDELLERARAIYGVEVSEAASKVEILTLIQEGASHGANAS